MNQKALYQEHIIRIFDDLIENTNIDLDSHMLANGLNSDIKRISIERATIRRIKLILLNELSS